MNQLLNDEIKDFIRNKIVVVSEAMAFRALQNI